MRVAKIGRNWTGPVAMTTLLKNIRATHGWILRTGTVHVVRISKTKRWKALQRAPRCSKSKMGFPQSSWRGTSHLRFWGSRFLKPVPGKFQSNSVSRNHQGCTNWARGIRFVNQVSGTKSGRDFGTNTLDRKWSVEYPVLGVSGRGCARFCEPRHECAVEDNIWAYFFISWEWLGNCIRNMGKMSDRIIL